MPSPAPEPDAPAELRFATTAVASPAACVRANPLDHRRRARVFGTGPLASIAGAVERLRGLRFDQPVDVQFLDQEELGRRVVRLAFADYDENEQALDQRLLHALGLLDAEDDIGELMRRALKAQVVGFYVPSTQELVVSSTATARDLPPLAEVTLAHELEHALADQALGFPVRERSRRREAEAQLAARALVEGDATLAMLQYASSVMSLRDQLAVAGDGSVARQTAALARLPHLLRQSLEFPYEEGFRFVCSLFTEGGWAAVDRAYRHPPKTTAEVLWPQLYRRREPVRRPPPPGTLPPPWRERFTQPVGAADLLWLFEAPADEPDRALDDAPLRAAAWSGGLVSLWTNGPRTALALSLVERAGVDTLCGSMQEWYRASFRSALEMPLEEGEVLAVRDQRQAAVVACSRRRVRLGIAPSAALARKLVALERGGAE